MNRSEHRHAPHQATHQHQELVIKILIVEKSVDAAQELVSQLRNHGIAVRPVRIGELSQMAGALHELEPDLVLFNPAAGIPLPALVQELNASGKDLALIVLTDQPSDADAAKYFDDGAQGLALRKQFRQTTMVIHREFNALQTRRQLRRMELALHESERRCQALLESSRDAIAYIHEGMHVHVNQAYLETFGYREFAELLGMPVLDLISIGDAPAFKARLRQHSREENTTTLNLKGRRADDSEFATTVEFSSAMFEGESCLQLVFRQQKGDPILTEMLHHDPVTGLFKRTRTLAVIDKAVAETLHGKKGQSLLLIEPDNWYNIITSIGMGAADEILAEFAARLKSLLQPGDLAGLLSDHGFCVLLEGRHDTAVRAWIQALQQTIADSIFDAGTRSLTISASIGGCLLSEKNAQTEILIQEAQQALLNAQQRGIGQFELCDPSSRDKASAAEQEHWLELVKRALDMDDGFAAFQQNIVSLNALPGNFAEYLLRMKGPQGMVGPQVFLPVARKHGLAPAIDRWVLKDALRRLEDNERKGLITTYFVKLCGESLEDPTLLPWLEEQMARIQLKECQLVLETSESKVSPVLRQAQTLIRGWRAIGGRFALEQFGSGLNSYQILQHIEMDYLKIDRALLVDVLQQEENQAKIAEICRQARERNLHTIAEWVENAASIALLFACGVDFVQGNFLQEPQMLV